MKFLKRVRLCEVESVRECPGAGRSHWSGAIDLSRDLGPVTPEFYTISRAVVEHILSNLTLQALPNVWEQKSDVSQCY